MARPATGSNMSHTSASGSTNSPKSTPDSAPPEQLYSESSIDPSDAHGPLASSTPIPEQYRDQDPGAVSPKTSLPYSPGLQIANANPQNNDSPFWPEQPPSATETTPLLRHRSTDLESGTWSRHTRDSRKSGRSSIWSEVEPVAWTAWAAKTLVTVLILAVISYIAVSQVDFPQVARQALVPSIQGVSVVEVGDYGVAVQVVATVETDYERINGTFARWMAKTGSVAVGGVTVAFSDPCRVYVAAKGARVHLFDVLPPDFQVDLINHRTSEIEFLTEVSVPPSGLAPLAAVLGDLLRNKTAQIHAEVLASPEISCLGLHFSVPELKIEQELVLQPGKPPVRLENSSVALVDDSLRLGLQAVVDPLPIAYEVGELHYDVLLPDCEGQKTAVGEWRSSPLQFSLKKNATAEIMGEVSEVPPELLQQCSDGTSPLDRFLGEVAENEVAKFFFALKDIKANENVLPKWAFEAFRSVPVPFEVPMSNIQPDPPILGYTVESAAIEVSPNTENLEVRVGSRAVVDVAFPVESTSFKASNLVATLRLYESGDTKTQSYDMEKSEKYLPKRDLSEFARMSIGKGDIKLSEPRTNVSCAVSWDIPDVNVSIADPSLVGRKISDFLRNQPVKSGWAVDVDEVSVESRLLTTTLRHLKFGKEIAQKESSFFSDPHISSSFLDWAVAHMNISVDSVVYVESSSTKIDLWVDFSLVNPTGVSMSVPGDTLQFEYLYNNTVIGSVSLPNLDLENSSGRQNHTALVSLFYESVSSRVLAEEFMSKLISASPKTRVDLKGAGSNNPGLGELLRELKIERITIPDLSFQAPEPEEVETRETVIDSGIFSKNLIFSNNLDLLEEESSKKSRRSPFLIAATFHLWTSEIELTVFNPLANMEISASIEKCVATYEGEILAHIEKSDKFSVLPGVQTTPRIPIEISKGLGADILRRAMNGDLAVSVVAEISARVGQFPADLMYSGSGLTAKVKL